MRARFTIVGTALCALAVGSPVAFGGQAGTAASTQPAASAASAPGHLYHITALRAAPGKTEDLLKLLSAPNPAPSAIGEPDFTVVFQHRDGNDWDFLLVEHMGTTVTIRVPPAAPEPGAGGGSVFSQVTAWHGDTFAVGPPLEEFRRALALEGTQANAKALYVITDYQSAPGHRSSLRDTLDQMAKDTPGRTATLTHLEGAPWNFLTVVRYDSWRQLADESEGGGRGSASSSGGQGQSPRFLQLRQDISDHHDTYAAVVSVQAK